MKIFSPSHPIWLAGFRPFFTLAIILGLFLPILWALIFSGILALSPEINPLQWHAHEMLYGFGGAVLIGFLLTASKNWVHIRGIHGLPLMGLTALWLVERVAFYFLSSNHSILRYLFLSAFISTSAAYIFTTLILNRSKDTFKDNYFFYILLGIIIVAKNLLLSESYYQQGVAMSVGIFRLAFVVMFERTITQFMKNTEGITLLRNPALDFAIKASVLISIFQSFLPEPFAGITLAIAGGLLFVRWLLWQPTKGFRKFGNGTMYLGYFGLILHFALETLKVLGFQVGIGTISLHTFTFLCMGVVIPSMLVRISQGHTGRKPEFLPLDKIAISLILLSAFSRLILPTLVPEKYTVWIIISGVLWFLAFALLGYRLIPFLLKPRVDGKVH